MLLKTIIQLNDSLAKSDPTLAAESVSVDQQLQLIDQRLEGHINSAETLALRIQATLGLVSKMELTHMIDLTPGSLPTCWIWRIKQTQIKSARAYYA